MFDGQDPAMQQAYEAAQRSFKYFWRELSWEDRRIVPRLDMSMVKLPFSDGPRTDDNAEFEHMWIGEIGFDGTTLSGKLLNSPNWLTSVREGDAVEVPFSRLTDWMMTVDRKAYGGFTVNVMRAKMGARERKQHDNAWGLDFGDPAHVRVEIPSEGKSKRNLLSGLFGKQPKPKAQQGGHEDHPACVMMLEKIEARLKGDPELVHSVDDAGLTWLHMEALAGNFGVVKLLVSYGVDVSTKTRSGRTASELARNIGWSEIAEYLEKRAKA